MALGTRELRPCKEALEMPKGSYGKRGWALLGKVSAGAEWGLQGGQEGLMMLLGIPQQTAVFIVG